LLDVTADELALLVERASSEGRSAEMLDIGSGVKRENPASELVKIRRIQGVTTISADNNSAHEVRAGAASALPYDDSSFDLIISTFAVTMLEKDIGRVYSEIIRTLRPGGRAILAPYFLRADDAHSRILVQIKMSNIAQIIRPNLTTDYRREAVLDFLLNPHISSEKKSEFVGRLAAM
jgi:SAM-dependent methyltransferase